MIWNTYNTWLPDTSLRHGGEPFQERLMSWLMIWQVRLRDTCLRDIFKLIHATLMFV